MYISRYSKRGWPFCSSKWAIRKRKERNKNNLKSIQLIKPARTFRLGQTYLFTKMRTRRSAASALWLYSKLHHCKMRANSGVQKKVEQKSSKPEAHVMCWIDRVLHFRSNVPKCTNNNQPSAGNIHQLQAFKALNCMTQWCTTVPLSSVKLQWLVPSCRSGLFSFIADS